MPVDDHVFVLPVFSSAACKNHGFHGYEVLEGRGVVAAEIQEGTDVHYGQFRG